ncbi:MAG: ATP-binding protein, partial [Holophagales bacterium]|nr:ATP-binding protein [Holophagales bacterium]
EQLLINLVKNAVEAVFGEPAGVGAGQGARGRRSDTGPAAEPSVPRSSPVMIRWRRREGEAVVEVVDRGPGVASTDNLFVPFFTTKPGGSGIGLVLCRQIAEAHGGSLTLENRGDGSSGCVARVALPL